jgi:hypothetical protein
MLTKTLIASAVAGALSFPIASYANDSSTGVMGSSVQSQAGAVQTQAGDLTFSQGSFASASIADSIPESVTWYYPDGSVFTESGGSIVAEIPVEVYEFQPLELALVDSESGRSETWYFPDGSVMEQQTFALMELDESASTGSGDYLILSESSDSHSGSFDDAEQLALVPTGNSETWYFPDGSVAEQQTFALMESDESASTGSSDYLILSDSSESGSGSSWLVAEMDPTFVIVTE